MTFDVEIANWTSDGPAITDIRRTVFIQEQGVPEQKEQDGLDALESTQHFLGKINGATVATARVLANGKIGRLCITAPYRQKGFGEKLLRNIVFHAIEERGQHALFLHAQVAAIPFYQKCGFASTGEVFIEANIPHRRMELDTQNRDAIEAIYQDRVLRPSGKADYARHLYQCTRIANRSIDILTADLSNQLFNSNFSQVLSAFVRANKHTKVRALIKDTRSIGGASHPVVALAHRLPSSISLRRITGEAASSAEGFSLFDLKHLVFFNNEANLQGFINYQAPAEARHHLEHFDNLWQHHSEHDPNLAQISI